MAEVQNNVTRLCMSKGLRRDSDGASWCQSVQQSQSHVKLHDLWAHTMTGDHYSWKLSSCPGLLKDAEKLKNFHLLATPYCTNWHLKYFLSLWTKPHLFIYICHRQENHAFPKPTITAPLWNDIYSP